LSDQKILIPRASDKEVIGFFMEFMPLINAASVRVHQIGRYAPLEISASDEKSLNNISDPDKYTLKTVQAMHNGYGLSYISGAANEQSHNFHFDQLAIHFNNNSTSLSGEPLNNLHKLINQYFLAKARHAAPLFGDPEAFQTVITSHQTILTRLESSLANVADNFARERLALESKNSEYKAHLSAEFDREKEILHSEYRKKEETLRAAEESLEERKKQLDDRDNTHARRKIREDLKKRIDDHSKAFQLTKGTKSLRTPIHISVLLSLALLGTLISYYGYIAATTPTSASGLTDIALLVVKPLGLTIAFLGLLTWYLRWMNRWFERHAEAEFQLKQFELDVDRASWVVETALEWRHEQHAAMPDHLIESISRNLFSKSDKDEGADMHPADYLASALLGRASGLRLKLPGGEIEYGAKALKEARATADKAEQG